MYPRPPFDNTNFDSNFGSNEFCDKKYLRRILKAKHCAVAQRNSCTHFKHGTGRHCMKPMPVSVFFPELWSFFSPTAPPGSESESVLGQAVFVKLGVLGQAVVTKHRWCFGHILQQHTLCQAAFQHTLCQAAFQHTVPSSIPQPSSTHTE